jgi:hypothetical protein
MLMRYFQVWSYEAQNKTVRAVLKAFSKSYFPMLRNISLCNEPEACALYTSYTATERDRCRLQIVSITAVQVHLLATN